MGYLGNFIVYTLAMVGVIVLALLVFKTTASGGSIGRKSRYLKLIDTMSLGQRKNLYIVSTGKEQFLIAGDVDKTTLISKIENINIPLDKHSSKQEFNKQNKLKIKSSIPNNGESVGIWSSMLDKMNK